MTDAQPNSKLLFGIVLHFGRILIGFDFELPNPISIQVHRNKRITRNYPATLFYFGGYILKYSSKLHRVFFKCGVVHLNGKGCLHNVLAPFKSYILAGWTLKCEEEKGL